MENLSGKQRRWLRARAHHLDPVVIVGQGGLSGPVLLAIDEALDDHELIKVRIADPGLDRKEIAAEIAMKLECEIAGTVGRVAILYRPSRKPEKRRLSPPSSGAASD